jgi:rubrerythrin
MERLISADKLENFVLKEMSFWDNRDAEAILDAIQKQPTVDTIVEEHGKWIFEGFGYTSRGDSYEKCVCSQCDYEFAAMAGDFPKYCPMCGAIMD